VAPFPAGRPNPPLSIPGIGIAGYSSSQISGITEIVNEQGEALRLHFEAVVSWLPLSCQCRGGSWSSELRTKTFLGNPLCRGVDELCTKQLASRTELFVGCYLFKDAFMKSHSQRNRSYSLRGNNRLEKENMGLEKENFRQDMLLDYWTKQRSGVLAISDQSESVLVHYNELQPIAFRRSGGHGNGI
jgi:hypothetical protein